MLPTACGDVLRLFLRVEPGNKAAACFSETASLIIAIVSPVGCLAQAALCCQGFSDCFGISGHRPNDSGTFFHLDEEFEQFSTQLSGML